MLQKAQQRSVCLWRGCQLARPAETAVHLQSTGLFNRYLKQQDVVSRLVRSVSVSVV